MIREKLPIPGYQSILTHIDETQVPLGGALLAQNIISTKPGRLRKAMGLDGASTFQSSTNILVVFLLFVAEGLGTDGENKLIAAIYDQGADARVEIWNITDNAMLSGPVIALGSSAIPNGWPYTPWTYTFYNNKWMFAGSRDGIYQLDNATTYTKVTGSPSPPNGTVIKSFYNRLYVADNTANPGVVEYSDVLTTNFPAANLINLKEVAGRTMSLGINAGGTDAAGIRTQLLIGKEAATWLWDEASLDQISSDIGIPHTNTIVNTPAGTIFAGQDKSGRRSVFLLRPGQEHEAFEIGEGLEDILNSTTTGMFQSFSDTPRRRNVAVYSDGFYRLGVEAGLTPGTTAFMGAEYWFDVLSFVKDGSIIWYGPQKRGSFDFMARGEFSGIKLMRRGGVSTTKLYVEVDAPTNFLDTAGAALVSQLSLPINLEPMNEEKTYELAELQLSAGSNLSGNEITSEVYKEGVSQGTETLSLNKAGVVGAIRVRPILRPSGRTGMTARNARLVITHSLNKVFEIIGMDVQYKHAETRQIRNED